MSSHFLLLLLLLPFAQTQPPGGGPPGGGGGPPGGAQGVGSTAATGCNPMPSACASDALVFLCSAQAPEGVVNAKNYLLFVDTLFKSARRLHVAGCRLHVTWCMLPVACCLLHVAYCMLSVACCPLHVAYCMHVAVRACCTLRVAWHGGTL